MVTSLSSGQCLEATFIDQVEDISLNELHVAIDGSTAVLIDPENREGVVYERLAGEWVEADRITSFPEPADDSWGIDVALDGDFIAVGGNGTVHLYRRKGMDWVPDQVLNDPQKGGFFGRAIAMDNGRLLVGDANHLVDGIPRGIVYLYTRPTDEWQIDTEILPRLTGQFSRFGAQVAMSGDLFIASDTFGDETVFRIEGDESVTELFTFPITGDIEALIGNRIITTSFDELRIFDLSGDIEEILYPGDMPSFLVTGVAALETVLLVADSRGDGAVQVYRKNPGAPGFETTSQFANGLLPPPVNTARFGLALAVDGDAAIIASLNPTRRRVDFYTGLSPADCNSNNIPDTCEIIAAPGLDEDNDNAIDVCDDDAFTFYIGPEGGDWFDSGNWTRGAPGSSRSAVVTSHVRVDPSIVPSTARVDLLRIEAGGVVEMTTGHLQAAMIDVRPGGTLTGEGTVEAIIDNHGTVAPGNTIGTLEIRGSYRQHSDGVLSVDITGDSPALRGLGQDVLEVIGSVNLAGELRIVRHPDFPLSGEGPYTVLTFDHRNGDFDHVTALTPTTNTLGRYAISKTRPMSIEVTFGIPDPVEECVALDESDDTSGGVALQGDTLVHGLNIWQRDQSNRWAVVQALELPDGIELETSTPATAIDGEIIGIGDPTAGGEGVVHVFRQVGPSQPWVYEATLHHPEPEVDHRFGLSLAVQDDSIFVGAPVHDFSGFVPPTRQGSVVIFHFDGSSWNVVDQLSQEVPGHDEHFGQDLAVSGDRLLIGGWPLDNLGIFNLTKSVAWLYQRNPDTDMWEFQYEIEPTPIEGGDQIQLFGITLDIDGDTAVIGSSGRLSLTGPYDRLAHVFQLYPERSVEVARFAERGDAIVYIVANRLVINDGTIAHGIIRDTTGAPGGRVYIYRRIEPGVWHRDPEQFLAHDDQAHIGSFIALDDGTLAFTGDTDNADLRIINGVAPGDCNNNFIADQCDILSGKAGDKNKDGRPDDCPTTCPGDCAPAPDGNGVINIDDLLTVVVAIAEQNLDCDIAPQNPDGTIGDGVVNIDDLFYLINNFGPCP